MPNNEAITEQEQINESADLIQLHFGLEDNSSLLACHSLNELEQELARIINQFLDQDLQSLLQAFYRLDIDENKVKKILSLSDTSEMAILLAREVISRELQKVLTRRKYRE